MHEHLQASTARYEPKPYSGHICLIRSTLEPTGWLFDPYAGWEPFAAGGVDLTLVEGNHFTVFQDPGATQIASFIDKCIGADVGHAAVTMSPAAWRCGQGRSRSRMDEMKSLIQIAVEIVVLALLLAARVALKSFLGERRDFLRTPSTNLSRHPESTGIAAIAEISFSTALGSRIAAWYSPSRNRAGVVLVHGTGADRSGMLTEAQILSAAGFGILALDLPGQGASEGQSQWGEPERKAISAALSWLQSQSAIDPARIGGLGMSMGAYVLAQTAAEDHRFRALVLESSPSDVVEQLLLLANRWGRLSFWPAMWALHSSGMPLDNRPVDVAPLIAPRPVLIIQGELDTLVPPAMGMAIHDAARDPKELWIVPGAGHVNYAQVAMAAYQSRLVDFFRRTLLN